MESELPLLHAPNCSHPGESWNDALSPWKLLPCGEAGFRRQCWGHPALSDRAWILDTEAAVSSPGKRQNHSGGDVVELFALWASTQTDLVDGIAAASPSVIYFHNWYHTSPLHLPLSGDASPHNIRYH